jgi:hypothetical protein
MVAENLTVMQAEIAASTGTSVRSEPDGKVDPERGSSNYVPFSRAMRRS